MKDFIQEMVALAEKEKPGSRKIFDRGIRITEKQVELVRTLIAARKASGLTQAQVAKQMSVSQPRIAKLESMDESFNFVNLLEYAEVVGVSIEVTGLKKKAKAKTKSRVRTTTSSVAYVAKSRK